MSHEYPKSPLKSLNISTLTDRSNALLNVRWTEKEISEDISRLKWRLSNRSFADQPKAEGSFILKISKTVTSISPVNNIPNALSNKSDREICLGKSLRYKRRCCVVETMLGTDAMEMIEESRKKAKFSLEDGVPPQMHPENECKHSSF